MRALVDGAERTELPALAAELGRAMADVLARCATPAVTPPAPSTELLDVGTAAQRLNVAPSWLYRHAARLPFTRKMGHRTLRFDARALERWAASQHTRPA